MIIGDWRQFWEPTTSINDGSFNVICNEDDKFGTFMPQSSDTSLLAAVKDEKNISLLYCSTTRQEVPFCTSCVVRKCKHYRQLVYQPRGPGFDSWHVLFRVSYFFYFKL